MGEVKWVYQSVAEAVVAQVLPGVAGLLQGAQEHELHHGGQRGLTHLVQKLPEDPGVAVDLLGRSNPRVFR